MMGEAKRRREWRPEDTAAVLDQLAKDAARETQRFVEAKLERYRRAGVPDVCGKAALGQALARAADTLIDDVNAAAAAGQAVPISSNRIM
jgi:hypothetical protein